VLSPPYFSDSVFVPAKNLFIASPTPQLSLWLSPLPSLEDSALFLPGADRDLSAKSSASRTRVTGM